MFASISKKLHTVCVIKRAPSVTPKLALTEDFLLTQTVSICKYICKLTSKFFFDHFPLFSNTSEIFLKYGRGLTEFFNTVLHLS